MDDHTAEPTSTRDGVLDWQFCFDDLRHSDPPSISIDLLPIFTGYDPAINEDACIVWDLHALVKSAQRPGKYYLVNCECGYAPCSEIYAGFHVTHPNAETVVWEIDTHILHNLLAPEFRTETPHFLRLVFTRNDYEEKIFQLITAVQHYIATPFAVCDLPQNTQEILAQYFPTMKHIELDYDAPVGGWMNKKILQWTRSDVSVNA